MVKEMLSLRNFSSKEIFVNVWFHNNEYEIINNEIIHIVLFKLINYFTRAVWFVMCFNWLIDWLIDCSETNAVLAISQLCNNVYGDYGTIKVLKVGLQSFPLCTVRCLQAQSFLLGGWTLHKCCQRTIIS